MKGVYGCIKEKMKPLWSNTFVHGKQNGEQNDVHIGNNCFSGGLLLKGTGKNITQKQWMEELKDLSCGMMRIFLWSGNWFFPLKRSSQRYCIFNFFEKMG